MTRGQHRVLRIVAVTTAFVVATPFMLAMAIMSAPPSAVSDPARVVVELDRLASAGDWEAAHEYFDYAAKGRTMFPDLWEAASPDEHAAFIAFWRPQFRKGWERTRGASDSQRWTLVETRLGPTKALVEQHTKADGEDFTIRYWLVAQGDRWRIVDRTYRRDGAEHSGTPLVLRIRQQVAGQLGREPTLAELVANAPSWIGRVRSRTYKVK